MRRLAIYAHYDAQHEVKRYVEYYLARLRRECTRIEFVSNAVLPDRELDKVRRHCDGATVRENRGFDFGMWQDVIERCDLEAWDEIALTNSSMFGPVHPLRPLLTRMAAQQCDFWGMTDNQDYDWHLQSYFLVFKRSVLRSEAFRAFWRSVLPYRHKVQVVRAYEVGLTIHLQESGFRPQALISTRSLLPRRWSAQRIARKLHNPVAFYPLRLLERGMPFVKVETLRDNPARIRLEPVLRHLRLAGYDPRLLEFDRPPVLACSRRWRRA